jgi:hypothetical protein
MKKRLYKKLENIQKKVPPLVSKETVIGAFSFFLLSLFLGGWLITSKADSLESMAAETAYVENLVKMSVRDIKSKEKPVVITDYVESVLGEMKFLSEDYKELSYLCAEVSPGELFSGIEERYTVLTENAAGLEFEKQKDEKSITWTSKNPVEMSKKDFSLLMQKVEGEAYMYSSAGKQRPNIYFSKLKLNKADHLLPDIYLVDIQIIQKREP